MKPSLPNSTSVNLFKVLGAALGLRPDRHVILSERVNFPTDLYIAQGLASLMGGGYALRLVERSEIEAALGSDIAVVMLTHADYRSGRLWDMKRITALAHQAGGFDGLGSLALRRRGAARFRWR